MPVPMENLTGRRYGRLIVLPFVVRRQRPSGQLERFWLCRCVCGKKKWIAAATLRGETTRSCGCLRREMHTTHGHTRPGHRDPLYQVWTQMIQRCHNSKDRSYHNYGARGIYVCDRWRGGGAGFLRWLEDMGPRPENGTIERKDNNGPYDPSNCRWGTRTEQNKNSRNVRLVAYDGRTQCLKDWARELKIPYKALHFRLRLGWSVARAFATPVTEERSTRLQRPQLVTWRQKTQHVRVWAEELGIDVGTLKARLQRMSPEDAFTMPVRVRSSV